MKGASSEEALDILLTAPGFDRAEYSILDTYIMAGIPQGGSSSSATGPEGTAAESRSCSEEIALCHC